MADTMKFGPQWLRMLSDGGTNNGNSNNDQGTNEDISPGNTNNSSSGRPDFIPLKDYKEPQYQYSREDILSLFPPNCDMPTDIDNDLNYITISKAQHPVSFCPVGEEEMRLLSQPVNSNAILRKHTATMPMIRSPSERGIGRGRGRGEGNFYLREEDPFSRTRHPQQQQQQQQREWTDDGRGYGRSYNSRQYENHDSEQPRSPYVQRQFENYDCEQPGNGNHTFQRSSSSNENWRNHADNEETDDGWRKMSSKHDRWRGASQMQTGNNWRNNDSYRHSYHEDRHSNYSNYQRKSENGNIPEWISDDTVTDIATGSFDASGAFVKRKDNIQVKKTNRKLSLKLVTGAEGEHIISDITDSLDSDNPSANAKNNGDSKTEEDPKELVDEFKDNNIDPMPKKVSKDNDVNKSTKVYQTPHQFGDYAMTQENFPKNHTTIEPQSPISQSESHRVSSHSAQKEEQIERKYLKLENPPKNIMDWFEKRRDSTEKPINTSIHFPNNIGRASNENHDIPHVDLSQIDNTPITISDQWQYIDPKDKVQGPFTMNEMEDWFNAGYFTHDLKVKRTTDSAFIPLGYMIRKLGDLPFRSEAHFQEPIHIPQQPQHKQQLFENNDNTFTPIYNTQDNSDADVLLRNLNEAVTSSGEILPEIPISSALSVTELEASQQIVNPMPPNPQNIVPQPSRKQIWNDIPNQVPKVIQNTSNICWPSKNINDAQVSAYQAEIKRNESLNEKLNKERIIEEEKLKLEQENLELEKERERIATARLAKQIEKERKEKERLKLLEESKIQEELLKERKKLRKKAEEEKQKKVERQLEKLKLEEIAKEKKEKELLKLEVEKEAEKRKQESIKKQQKIDDFKFPAFTNWANKPTSNIVGESLSNIQKNQIDKQVKKEKADIENQKKTKAAQVIEQQTQSTKSWSNRVGPKAKNTVNKSSILDIQNEQGKNEVEVQSTPPPVQKIVQTSQSIKSWNNSAASETQNIKNKIKPLMETCLWDDVPTKCVEQPFIVQKSKKSNKQQPTNQKVKESKVKKEQEKVKSLFDVNKDRNEFTLWCEKALKGISGNIDVPTFVSFLTDIESPYEVRDYVKGYIGDNATAAKFAEDFILARSAFKNKSNKVSLSNSSNKMPLNIEQDSNDFVYVSGKGNKKNKKKMQKLDSSILGFTVHAAPDRINAGEIDYT